MVGDKDGGKREGGGDCPFHFFDFNGFGGGVGMTSQDWWQKFIFLNWQNGSSVFEGPFCNRIESEKKI